jgi:hypothetical protein
MILSDQMCAPDQIKGIRRLLSHPRICCDLGELFLREGHMKLAKHAFQEGASYGLHYSTAIYDEMFLSAVGACFTHLLTSFLPANMEAVEKGTALAYVYLSHCICLNNKTSAKAHHLRALLLDKHKDPTIVQQMILRFYDRRVLPDNMIIADYATAASLCNEDYQHDMDRALLMNEELSEIFDICNTPSSSIENVISEGSKCHKGLLKMMTHYARNGYFNMEMEDLQTLNR